MWSQSVKKHIKHGFHGLDQIQIAVDPVFNSTEREYEYELEWKIGKSMIKNIRPSFALAKDGFRYLPRYVRGFFSCITSIWSAALCYDEKRGGIAAGQWCFWITFQGTGNEWGIIRFVFWLCVRLLGDWLTGFFPDELSRRIWICKLPILGLFVVFQRLWCFHGNMLPLFLLSGMKKMCSNYLPIIL